jgi:hypothetical protein
MAGRAIGRKQNMTQTIPETFLARSSRHEDRRPQERRRTVGQHLFSKVGVQRTIECAIFEVITAPQGRLLTGPQGYPKSTRVGRYRLRSLNSS